MGLLLGVVSAFAGDLLVPSATPRSPEDQVVAASFHAQVLRAALQANVTVDDPAAIRNWIGEAEGEACYSRPDRCPGNLWVHTQARVAMVMSVGVATDGSLEVEARYFAYGSPKPIHVHTDRVPPGDSRFPERLVANAVEILQLTPARAAPKVVGSTTNTGRPTDPAAPVTIIARPTDPVLVDPTPVDATPIAAQPPVARTPDRPATTTTDGAEPPPDSLAIYERISAPDVDWRLPNRTSAAWVAAGRPAASTWLEQQHVRVSHFWIELGGGYSIGEVNRSYGFGLLYDPTTGDLGSAWSQGPTWDQAATLQLGVGYMPTWFFDVSLRGGLHNSSRSISRCASSVDPAVPESAIQCLSSATTGSARVTEPELRTDSTLQWLIEPRVRWFPVATGAVKPYLLTAGTVRVHSGAAPAPKGIDYSDGSSVDLEYARIAPGVSAGLSAGPGMVIEVLRSAAFFVEVPATWLFAPGIDDGSSGYIVTIPERDYSDTHVWIRALVGLELHL